MSGTHIDPNHAAIPIRVAPSDVRIEGVDLAYGPTPVLKGIDLEIAAGELFAFLGPSGCGKTTLLRLIAGFAEAQRGRVLIGGDDVTAKPPWKRDVGLVFQSYALWPHMTVARNVAFGLEERRVAGPEIARRVASVLEVLGLSALAERRPAQLSGGQQQRVALARTLVVEPKVLLLDEPLSNLDAKMRVEVRHELKALQRRLGMTTIFVTHDQEEANSISDRMAVMRDGVVAQVGTPAELYEAPADLFVAGFLGTANILAGRCESRGGTPVFVIEGAGDVPIPGGVAPAPGARLLFRPHAARLAPYGTAPVAGGAALAGTVASTEFLGAAIRHAVRIGGAIVQVDAPSGPRAPRLAPGDKVDVLLDPADLRWLAA